MPKNLQLHENAEPIERNNNDKTNLTQVSNQQAHVDKTNKLSSNAMISTFSEKDHIWEQLLPPDDYSCMISGSNEENNCFDEELSALFPCSRCSSPNSLIQSKESQKKDSYMLMGSVEKPGERFVDNMAESDDVFFG
ncbi:unnamed protein product [Caenorhabditis bovis]|uniref:Uncharacterized protein n=1 Tax=Caenorhabditis bovis TaxID=2654633 RepID=A0A8S1EBU9_9PELO|nr:unnamed protein product [Caenorhabditis bovis]